MSSLPETREMRLIRTAVDLLYDCEETTGFAIEYALINTTISPDPISYTIEFKKDKDKKQIIVESVTIDEERYKKEFENFENIEKKSFGSDREELKNMLLGILDNVKGITPGYLEMYLGKKNFMVFDYSYCITESNARAVKRAHAAAVISRVWKMVSSDPNHPIGRKHIMAMFNEAIKENAKRGCQIGSPGAGAGAGAGGGKKIYKKYQNRKYLVKQGKRGGKYIVVDGKKLYV